MFESIGPQEVTYIQKESPRTGDSLVLFAVENP